MLAEPFISGPRLQKADELVRNFEPVTLDEIKEVNLMDRTEMKFILPFTNLSNILEYLPDSYRVLTIDNKKIFNYRTEYFDTPELVMYYDHHNGKLNRFKVRQREYIESKLSFIEVKFRSNKGRVIKQRIEEPHTGKHLFADFIARHTPYIPAKLNCTVVNQFNRFTFVDRLKKERVTTDFNLVFSDGSRRVYLNDLVIIELKQNLANRGSPIYQVLEKLSIRPATVSKYCLGISLLNETAKSNNFKEILLKINKMSHVMHTI